MRRLSPSLLTLALLALPLACSKPTNSTSPNDAAGQQAAAEGRFGDALPSAASVLSVDQALAQPVDAAQLVLEGRVDQVCQASGCWLELAGQGKNLTLIFENGAGQEFTVTKDLAGKQVRAFGKLEVVGGETQLLARGVQVLR